ncbi:MAG TPA: hypothetical protein VN706_14895 [Gemmatimonadaceae bacterium]|nr:hypothetical protein [Gemmatimonadaceae bacterium]
MDRSYRWAAVFATILVAGAAAPITRVQGVSYTIRGSTHRARPVPAIPDTGYTAHVVWATSRGRMDIVSGAQRPLFAEGDYILFDSTDYIVVHPAAQTYSTPPDMSGMSSAPGMDQMRDAMKVSDIHMSLDTLERGVMINGFRTTHYRTRSSFTITIDMSAFGAAAGSNPPSTTTEAVTDIWYADTVAATPSPFVSTARELPAMMGAMKEVFDRTKALRAAMPTQLLAVRTTTISRAIPAGSVGPVDGNSENAADISDFIRTNVDVSRLALPASYTLVPMAGTEMFGSPKPLAPEVLAKWRSVPKE